MLGPIDSLLPFLLQAFRPRYWRRALSEDRNELVQPGGLPAVVFPAFPLKAGLVSRKPIAPHRHNWYQQVIV